MMKNYRPPEQKPADNTPTSRRNLLTYLGFAGLTGVTLSFFGMGGLLFLLQQKQISESTPSNSISSPAIMDPTANISASPTPISPPPIVSRAEWGAKPPDHTAVNEFGFYNSVTNPEGWRVYEGELQDSYQTAVIHHSVVYNPDDAMTAKVVQNLHFRKGWADVAYHFMVGQNGAIFEGRELDARGTHVAGFNTGSVGICLLGNFEIDNPTIMQIESTRRLLQWLSYRLALTHLAGHQDFNHETQCPGAHLIPLLQNFALWSGLALGVGGYIPPADATPTAT
ncbi:hypothetical protein MASR2M15_17100 [Anaerolineales bacterium]